MRTNRIKISIIPAIVNFGNWSMIIRIQAHQIILLMAGSAAQILVQVIVEALFEFAIHLITRKIS